MRKGRQRDEAEGGRERQRDEAEGGGVTRALFRQFLGKPSTGDGSAKTVQAWKRKGTASPPSLS